MRVVVHAYHRRTCLGEGGGGGGGVVTTAASPPARIRLFLPLRVAACAASLSLGAHRRPRHCAVPLLSYCRTHSPPRSPPPSLLPLLAPRRLSRHQDRLMARPTQRPTSVLAHALAFAWLRRRCPRTLLLVTRWTVPCAALRPPSFLSYGRRRACTRPHVARVYACVTAAPG